MLEIQIDNLTREEAIKKINFFLQGDSFRRIATINPEFLLLSEKDDSFKQVLLAADLRLSDGVGMNLLFWRKGETLKARIPGADLLHDILKRSEEMGLEVYLALREDGLSSSQEIRSALFLLYPRLILTDKLSEAKVVFCNFGAPVQEVFLASLKAEPYVIRLAMGVGGSFDYITGKLKRAPKWMRVIGLEWLWRLLLQPQRFRRIWNAVVVFPIRTLLS